jgi:hypothetical protein
MQLDLIAIAQCSSKRVNKKNFKKKKKKILFFFLQRGNTINLKEHKVYNRIGIVEHKISTAIE